jgi:hypothetical protein
VELAVVGVVMIREVRQLRVELLAHLDRVAKRVLELIEALDRGVKYDLVRPAESVGPEREVISGHGLFLVRPPVEEVMVLQSVMLELEDLAALELQPSVMPDESTVLAQPSVLPVIEEWRLVGRVVEN